MTLRSHFVAPLAALAITAAMIGTPHVMAQGESVLAEVYGRGVHAYYAGQLDQAKDYLTSAIEGGTRDPRAYYFRGMVDSQLGDTAAAEADWKEGAKMEAIAGGGDAIGRSLSRFQGTARLQLEQIRQKARLDALLTQSKRSDARLRQLGVDPNAATTAPAPTAPPASITPAPAAPAAPVADDPFADDGAPLAGSGDPKLESNNALEGLDGNPFEDDGPAAAGNAAAAPINGGDDANPFGAPAPAPAAGGDPFDTGNAPDPFAPPTGGDDPFGGDPFGN